MPVIKHSLKERSYNFSVSIVKFSAQLPDQRIYLIIVNQLVRAATSIGANIIEAQAASSKKDFAKFFIIALKSANETKYWLNLLKDTTNMNTKTIEMLLREVTELANILGASVITLRSKQSI